MVLFFLYVVLGRMHGGMWIMLYVFLIFQFWCRGVGFLGIFILQCCFVPIVFFVFSHLVLCRLVRSRVFEGCLCLGGLLCFEGQLVSGSYVLLCCQSRDPVGLCIPPVFCCCWSIWTLRCLCLSWLFCVLVSLLYFVRYVVKWIIVGC